MTFEGLPKQLHKLVSYQILDYDNRTYTYTVTPSSGLSLYYQSNPVQSTFTLQGSANTTSGSFTLTRSGGGCSPSTITVNVNFVAPSPGGYYTCGYSPSYGNNTTLSVYQSIGITNAQGGDIGMFITNTPYAFRFTSDLAGLYLENSTTSTNAIHFILKPGQGTTITATATNSPCPIVGRFAFVVPRTSNRASYSVAPNPVSSTLVVTAENADARGLFEVSIYDRFGKKVKTQRSSKDRVVLDVRDLPEGIYTVRSGNGKSALSKLIQITH